MLRVEDLTVRYGDAQILSGVTFESRAGTITTILGPNGAGKTTLLRAITGLVNPASGVILFEGRPVHGRKTHEMVQLGMTMIPEGRRLWPSLTVRENLDIGAYLVNDSTKVAERRAWVFELFPHLLSRQDQLCGTLSGGEQQMVALARGLMGFPKLLLLDEPSLGLAPMVVDIVFQAVLKIVEAGMTILLVEQNTLAALSVASYGYVLETGAIVLEGEAGFLRANPHVQEAYLGL